MTFCKVAHNQLKYGS